MMGSMRNLDRAAEGREPLEVAPPLGPDGEVLHRLLRQRFSCRGYLARQVPPETIDAILRLAQLTPSGCNTQPWRVTITSGAATDRFRAALTAQAEAHPAAPDLPFPREYRGVYKQRRRAAAWALYGSVGIAQGDRAGSARQTLLNFSFFGAPHVAIITTDEALGPYGVVDTGLYVGTFLLAAQCLGVAAAPQGAVAEHSGFIREYFDMGDDRLVVCGISFGYEDAQHPANQFRTQRAPISEVVTLVAD